jgi:multidrug efflux pump subunit AcrA (membrane-fusion protein)
MKRVVLVILAVLILLAVGLRIADCGLWNPKPEIRNPKSEIKGSGIIQSQADVVISAEVGGHVVALGAGEGDEVEAGTVLVRLDEELVLAQISRARAAVEGAEASLAHVKAEAQPSEIKAGRAAVDSAQAQVNEAEAADDIAEANLKAAEARHRMAQSWFARLTADPSERQLEIAEQKIELAKVQLWKAQAQRDATRAGVDMPLSIWFTWEGVEIGPVVIANPIGPQLYDVQAAEGVVLSAETGTRMAQLEYEWLKAGTRAEDLATVQADVAQAQAEVQIAKVALEQAQQAVSVAEAQLQQAQAELDLILAGPKPEEVAVAEAQVAQAQAEVDILEAQREKLSLRTPIAGLVTERTVHEGEIVLAGARLFIISRLDPVVLTIYVPEAKIGRVRVGQIADVSVDMHPGRAFRGEVIHIASQAEFTPRNIQTTEERTTTVFAVRIKLPNPEHLLKPGMPAEANLVDS